MLRRAVAHVRRHYAGFLALFVALGGTAYAATIDGSDIQTRSIPGNRIVLDGVGGNEVDESRLTTARGRAAFDDQGSNTCVQTGVFSNVCSTQITRTVPKGHWAAFGKASATMNNNTARVVSCVLFAGSDTDVSTESVSKAPQGGGNNDAVPDGTLANQVVHTFGGDGVVRLRCFFTGNPANPSDVTFRNLKITAISLGKLTNSEVEE